MNSESKRLAMMEALNSQASSIDIQNTESAFHRLYHINVPFQITLEYCSGSELEDFINIITLSSDRSILYQESFATKNYTRTSDALHFHDYFEFVIVLEGSIVQKIEGKDYLYTAGSCCLLNRSLCHLEHYHDRSKVLFIGMSPEFISELFDSAKTSSFQAEKNICAGNLYQFITADLKNPGQKAYLDFIPAYQNHQNAANLHSLAESMIRTLLYPDFGASYQIRGLFCAFMAYLSSPQYYHYTNIRLDTNSDFLLFSRITHLFEERNGRMSRAEFEKLLNYSGDYLNRIVNKYTGMCLYDYGMTFCLKKAAKYLKETDESISTIAAKLRFTNRTHFYSMFKAKYGVTPKEYRQMHA
ncbi:MAG: helix-turn-helix domain-containing protein [Lachnospiraceae bacterium]|nr:helix-turn-helix domain-containing protein [Lachnospiraceae bacterium]